MEITTTPTAIIALNPLQMADARHRTREWIDAKIAAANHDMDEADEVVTSLEVARLNAKPARTQLDKAAKRLRFYEKVKAAFEAGYYIVPPFDVQLFAVRVNRKANANRGDHGWNSESKGSQLAVGEGRYVDPTLRRVPDGIRQEPITYGVDTGKTRDVQLFATANWRDEIDLPVRAMKPTIIREVGRALQERIFDALGIAPQYRAADPIICGRINKPSGGHLTFLVAWWLDAEDLEA